MNNINREINCPPLCHKCWSLHWWHQPCKQTSLNETQQKLADNIEKSFINPNILNKTRCYMIGQMQYFDGAPWRNYVEAKLKQMNIIVFNPYNHPYVNSTEEDNDVRESYLKLVEEEKYDEVSEKMKKIRSEDLRTIDISDFVFCYINPKYPTCGAWEEFFLANKQKKPIFLVIEGSKKLTPLWVFGTIPHKYIYNNLDEALNMISDIDSGKHPIDSDRWRLLKQSYR